MLRQDKALLIPYQFYATHGLNALSDTGYLLETIAFQIVGELFVDTVCLLYEQKYRNVSASHVWPAIDKRWFLITYLFAAWYGFILAQGTIIMSEDFSFCMGKDLCCCVGRGLVRNGARQTYCEMLYPLNASLIPSASAAPEC